MSEIRKESQYDVQKRGFLRIFLGELFADLRKLQAANRDPFGYRPSPRRPRWKESLIGKKINALRNFGATLRKSRQFGILYDSLGDEASRTVLIKVLASRVLGTRRVKMPSNNSLYWKSVALTKERLLKIPHTIPIPKHLFQLGGWLDYYDLQEIGFPVRLHLHPIYIIEFFLLQHYSYDNHGTVISTEVGDTVIDAGSGWGDASLYFANRVGENGRVYCFEFAPTNLPILEKNLQLNEHLRERIRIIEQAIWDRSGESVSFRDMGLSSCTGGGYQMVPTTSIDDFVKEEELKRVDFIKMEIMGAELRGLRGAEQTIRSFRPKLAIVASHKYDDLITIPSYLKSLECGYEFYLVDLYSWGQVTLFAREKRRDGAQPKDS